ncbi:tRNA 2-thiouridine(34) synthase MnmA [Patescibacteria group bacterium]|nr:tRNA 2-thiouridine(34) synthase MnmA [Candidatus Falkowbacteria bacterium]MBU3905760.1 tRNA 2-thiouridine(34) synthase MnmA [Patescibacteria group bacterium]MCG2698453.1 tRNA 2-thiouridine(34) synthase MnmA [Candidatus Parcubacteria bacterium]MBU4026134.1 tRNA 2-thiouridine(34) synthase MnmA [Patescibacteria group bacterium]MBU4072857.1 tRNA 2-thiouridine(34) synthase MnmA [Patescibacteria group bacterium]
MPKCLKVVIAMSGGVDSSAAVFLLQKQGYEVIGMFMRLANNSDDEQAARRVCAKLGVKFYPVNYADQFKKEVIDYFLESYARGLTPNPCARCNRLIKFGALLKGAREIGADFLATGHYTKTQKHKNTKTELIYKLYRGKDEGKDQSYFLYNLTQKQLARVLFPLGEYTKEEVRKIADKAKLPYVKKESQDVCFLKGDHNDFLREHIKLKPGPIVALTPYPSALRASPLGKGRKMAESLRVPLLAKEGLGEVIGEHQGLPLYTIGQRKGVEIGGIGPFYAAKCDYKTNTLYVVSDRDDSVLYSRELIAGDVNWISGKEPRLPLSCQAVIRYRHKPVKCKVTKPPSGFKSHSVAVAFSQPQRAVTPGQSVVFYGIRRAATNNAHANYNNEDEVLGGGIIAA